MGRDHDDSPTVSSLAEDTPHNVRRGLIQPREWLVDEKDVRIRRKHTGQTDASPRPGRKAADPAAASVADAKLPEQVERDAFFTPSEAGGERNVLDRRELLEQMRGMSEQSDPGSDARRRGSPRDASASWGRKAGDDPQEGGLPRAVRALDGDQISRPPDDIDAPQGNGLAKHFRDCGHVEGDVGTRDGLKGFHGTSWPIIG